MKQNIQMKPLLASTIKDEEKIQYPIYVSPKLDGIRAILIDGVLYSRSLKPIRNRYIQAWAEQLKTKDILDGELIAGNFQSSTSSIMSVEGEPDFTYNVFDIVNNKEYYRRYYQLDQYRQYDPRLVVLDSKQVKNREELIDAYNEYLNVGHEGIMLRSITGFYKYGRSTEKEGYLMKLKPFERDEAVVVGYSEMMHNENEATTNELGYTERSTAAEGLVGTNKLGSLLLKSDKFEDEFSLGTGFTMFQRQELWNERENLIGKIVSFQYQSIGMKDVPRFPSFVGFRDSDDMS